MSEETQFWALDNYGVLTAIDAFTNPREYMDEYYLALNNRCDIVDLGCTVVTGAEIDCSGGIEFDDLKANQKVNIQMDIDNGMIATIEGCTIVDKYTCDDIECVEIILPTGETLHADWEYFLGTDDREEGRGKTKADDKKKAEK